ncbi:cyclin-SDS [Rhododendron vialii]|uniref:cyclin-SDS n=1 Tax=Rhododendron vialii TaxID=182163 RepID=UPI00265E03CF|nr:cyclin-SDS [Rhododendron vialii]
MKREAQPMQQRLKKLRSSLPRRRRKHISPIRLATSPAASIASSHLTREVSCESSRISVNNKQRVASPKKRRLEEISFGQSKQFQKVPKREKEEDEEERDSSCVQSCSGVDEAREINSHEFGVIEEHSVTTAKSELSCEFSRKIPTAGEENSIKNDFELSEVSRKQTVSKSDSTTEQRPPKLSGGDSDLACSESELVCYDDHDSDYSSAFTDLQSEVFHDSSDIDFSDEYTPSILFESGSEFSEKSITDDITPSPTFSLFLQYSQQFSRSTSDSLRLRSDGENSEEFACLRFEDEENEESYKMLRNRERRQAYFHDYAEEYCSATEYGELVIQQRLRMVQWIVEQSTKKKFQKETMFLGVNLLDRFLSKGYFITERNLQIVGIACLALATRIEENQPFNSMRQKTFRVDCNTYSRCEVVAMEWLVQEVLNFQCYLPTIYNFLWFYLKAAKANKEVEKTAKYLAVVALLGHEQLSYWTSTVAAGLVVLASLASNQDASCDRVMETHLRTKEDDLPGCMKSLEWLIKYAC